MSRNRRIIMSAIAGGLVALAAVPAAVSANTVASPGQLTFPERQVGSVSDPQTVTITVICNGPNPGNPPATQCTTNDTYFANPSLTGANPGDFSFVNINCPASLAVNPGFTPKQCTFQLRFAPTAPGARSAVFIAGTAAGGGPNAVALNGSAVAAPVTPVTPPPAKKCKKGFKKVKGKCKKKKKK